MEVRSDKFWECDRPSDVRSHFFRTVKRINCYSVGYRDLNPLQSGDLAIRVILFASVLSLVVRDWLVLVPLEPPLEARGLNCHRHRLFASDLD